MTIHTTHPFADPDPDPARRLRGRLGGAVTLWAAGVGSDRSGLTVTSVMVALGEPARVLALLDPDSDLVEQIATTGRAVVQVLAWPDRDLAEAFAGTAPAPGGAFRTAAFVATPWGPRLERATTWAGVVVEGVADVGWSALVTARIEHLEVGGDDEAAGAPTGEVAAAVTDHRVQVQARVRVMVVDDHPMWRDAVERDLAEAGFEVVGVAATGGEALARFPACRPQLVVLDLQIPAPTGVECTAAMLRHDPSARVLILSASGEQADVLEAVKAGATGYLVKSASRSELLDAVRRVAAGETVFTPGLAGLVLGEYRRLADPATRAPDRPRLTERETEVLRMVAKGLANQQIADRLVLSRRTVQNHVQNALRKLQLHNRVELTRWVIDQGLDDGP